MAAAVLALVLFGWAVPAAQAAPTTTNGVEYTVVPARVSGVSPHGALGEWVVDYEKLAGGDPHVADAVNRILDDEANGQVWLHAASASKSSPWTFRTQGRLLFRRITISALFVGQYDAVNLPNMPYDTVATRVFDSRSGIQIVWDNLFVDRNAGLARLSEVTKQLLPAAYPNPPVGGWVEYSHAMAPIGVNFKYWIPTAEGIELQFPEGQFGRERRSVTVPWAAVRELIAPVFLPIAD
ncbi:DUF3298 domain-containing protein [Mycolicibacterium parafortuitum]|uniref:DUF3298 domain-containing protein n=1 Tax=Mycolicibacterium parafortuitum TaxID=39692 RepID=UPI001F37D22D|nr:DUF3298 domain-containing protein [Mycolicibacterium parafortuitum]